MFNFVSVKAISAYLFLILFCFSTISSFGSVHFCKGEVTDIDFIGLAGCEHEKQEASHCHKNCCSSSQKKSMAKESHCCSTVQLMSSTTELANSVKTELVSKQLIAVIYTWFFIPVDLNTSCSQSSIHDPPRISKNLIVDIQCFRI